MLFFKLVSINFCLLIIFNACASTNPDQTNAQLDPAKLKPDQLKANISSYMQNANLLILQGKELLPEKSRLSKCFQISGQDLQSSISQTLFLKCFEDYLAYKKDSDLFINESKEQLVLLKSASSYIKDLAEQTEAKALQKQLEQTIQSLDQEIFDNNQMLENLKSLAGSQTGQDLKNQALIEQINSALRPETANE